MFIAQLPQMPSRQELRAQEEEGVGRGRDAMARAGRGARTRARAREMRAHRRNVRLGSCSFLIFSSASSTIGPHLRGGERSGRAAVARRMFLRARANARDGRKPPRIGARARAYTHSSRFSAYVAMYGFWPGTSGSYR
jgi:hypothetical protein